MKRIIYALIIVASIPLCSFALNIDWKPMVNEMQLRKLFINNSQLKDPESVRFKNVIEGTFPLKDNTNALFWCGEFNAKNSYGGYVGFKYFSVITSGLTGTQLEIEPDNPDLKPIFFKIFQATCAGSGISVN